MIKWKTTKEEFITINKIAKRTNLIAKEIGLAYPVMDADMDVTACHLNGCPLKLKELLEADNFNFSHDVLGIRMNIDRRTGKLQNCFDPRYSS